MSANPHNIGRKDFLYSSLTIPRLLNENETSDNSYLTGFARCRPYQTTHDLSEVPVKYLDCARSDAGLYQTTQDLYISEETWDTYKDDVQRLYNEQDHEIAYVLSALLRKRYFSPSASQLLSKIKEWGFYKDRWPDWQQGFPAQIQPVSLPWQPDRETCMTCGGKVDGVIYCSEQCRPSATLQWYSQELPQTKAPTVTTTFYTARSRFVSRSADSRASFDSTQFMPPPYVLVDVNPPSPKLEYVKEEPRLVRVKEEAQEDESTGSEDHPQVLFDLWAVPTISRSASNEPPQSPNISKAANGANNPFDAAPGTQVMPKRQNYPTDVGAQQRASRVKSMRIYANEAKDRFPQRPDTYEPFIQILEAYQQGGASLGVLFEQLAWLFRAAPDLREDFKQFFPRGLVRHR